MIPRLGISSLALLALVSVSFPALSETSETQSTENFLEFLQLSFGEEFQDPESDQNTEPENIISGTNILLLDPERVNGVSPLPRTQRKLLPIPYPLPAQGDAVKFLSPLAQSSSPSVAEPQSSSIDNTTTTSENLTEEQAGNQEAKTENATKKLAEAAQNPIANLISLPFQNNTFFGVGKLNRTQNTLNIQPVIPFDLNEDWLIVSRTILPIIYQPALTETQYSHFGLGDLNPSLFFVPKNNSKITWGFGPVFLLPTATAQSLGTGKWGIGPTAVIVLTDEPWVVGALVNNIWSIAGDNSRPDVSQFLLQPFINYNLPNGWYLVSSPIITANWNASSGNQWTVPIGGGFGKLFRIGRQPVNASLQAFWNVEKPTGGADWSIRAQFQLLFPRGR